MDSSGKPYPPRSASSRSVGRIDPRSHHRHQIAHIIVEPHLSLESRLSLGPPASSGSIPFTSKWPASPVAPTDGQMSTGTTIAPRPPNRQEQGFRQFSNQWVPQSQISPINIGRTDASATPQDWPVPIKVEPNRQGRPRSIDEDNLISMLKTYRKMGYGPMHTAYLLTNVGYPDVDETIVMNIWAQQDLEDSQMVKHEVKQREVGG